MRGSESGVEDGVEIFYGEGLTPLDAAMRCYVESRLGDTVDMLLMVFLPPMPSLRRWCGWATISLRGRFKHDTLQRYGLRDLHAGN